MKTHFKEGDIVNCVSKIKVRDEEIKNGTVWFISEEHIHVVDNEGYIHSCRGHEVYEIQTNG